VWLRRSNWLVTLTTYQRRAIAETRHSLSFFSACSIARRFVQFVNPGGPEGQAIVRSELWREQTTRKPFSIQTFTTINSPAEAISARQPTFPLPQSAAVLTLARQPKCVSPRLAACQRRGQRRSAWFHPCFFPTASLRVTSPVIAKAHEPGV